jgi:hypothetical protein
MNFDELAPHSNIEAPNNNDTTLKIKSTCKELEELNFLIGQYSAPTEEAKIFEKIGEQINLLHARIDNINYRR